MHFLQRGVNSWACPDTRADEVATSSSNQQLQCARARTLDCIYNSQRSYCCVLPERLHDCPTVWMVIRGRKHEEPQDHMSPRLRLTRWSRTAAARIIPLPHTYTYPTSHLNDGVKGHDGWVLQRRWKLLGKQRCLSAGEMCILAAAGWNLNHHQSFDTPSPQVHHVFCSQVAQGSTPLPVTLIG